MFELKRLTQEGIAAALKKAEQYRLLNEPRQAESICLDVLEVAPDSQPALVLLLLARTDQFARELGAGVERARELLPRLVGDYEQAYYAGIVCERWGKAKLTRGHPGSGEMAYDWLRKAMSLYEKAERFRPPGNDDALLRWNNCARIIMNHDHVEPGSDRHFEPLLE